MLKDQKNFLIYEPNILSRIDFIKELQHLYKDKKIILSKDKHTFIPKEIFNLPIKIEFYNPDLEYKDSILIFFYAQHLSSFNENTIKLLNNENLFVTFSDKPFILTEYLSLKNKNITENLPVCLFKVNFYNKLYVNALFVRFKSTEKFAKETWKDFLEKNEISSPALLEYLDFLFENEVFEFLYFKIYIESTFKRGFEYSPELKITSNKVYKLINLLEETEISHCVVQNKTVASIIELIIKRKNIKTQVKLSEELEEVNDSVIYFDFTIPTYQSNVYILISEDLKNYYLALAAKENLLYINCSEKKVLDYFVIEKLENHNTTLKNMFLKEEKFLKFSSIRVNNSEYQTKKYFQRLESRAVYSEKRIKNDENKCDDSIEEEYKENEYSFKPFIYDSPVILELEGSFSEEVFVDLLREIVKIKKYDQKTVLFVENVIDLPEILEKIYALTKTPIYITNLEENQLKSKIYIHQLKFGTVPKYGYFVDFYFLQGSGTLKFTPNGIIIIYNAPSLQYKIEINYESMENYTFISNVNQRLTLTMLLKKIDKVFIRENTYFWKRVSIYEVPFLENRYDIQFNIHKSTLIQFLTCFYNHTLVFVPNSLLNAYEFTLTQNKSNTSVDKNLSVKCVKKFLNCLSYEEFYYLECFLSQKGRILNYNLKESDLNKMKKSPNFIPMILQINSEIDERFVNIQEIINKYHNLRLKHEKNYNLIKVGYITPLRIIYEFPMWSDSNRILREFMLDKFIRFNFREEDCKNQVNKRSDYDTSLVFDHFRTFLLDGIFLGKKKFFFLAMSSSQLRQHSCLFMTPYFNTTLIGPDYIRNWMGDFSSVHNIGKCAARLGQVLSTTVPTLKVCDFSVEKDFIVNEYNFTDGIGMISFSFAKKVAYKLKLNFVPSAFQVRFAGFKGVLALKNINKEIILRESMKKFESNHRILEVISFAQRRPCFLNRQVVLILESLGIKKRDFMKFSDLTVKPTVLSPKPLNTFIRNLSENLTEQDEELDGGNFLLDLKDKCRIFINKGRILVGVIDEYDILEENEIFVMTKIAEEDVLDSSVEKVDNYLVLNSKAFIAKNPCLHPGDIRVVKGVNRKELYHYKEVVVFSKKGKRPIFNMCSGSDLDGDVFIVSWEECLIPNKTLLSDEYSNTMYLYRKIVSVSDIINFFVRYMQEDQIGLIANAHLAHSDKKESGVLSPESVRLAQLFNMGIDFPKTGYIASLPYDLFFNEVPDYLSQLNYRKYLSNKTIGVVFRRSSHLIMQKEIFCECKNCNFLVNKVEEILYNSCKFNTKEIKKEIKEEDSCDNYMVDLFYSFNKENNLFNIEKYSNLLQEIPGTWEEKYISYKKISQLNHSFFDFLFFCNYIPKEEIFYQNKFESFIFHDRIFLTEKVEDLPKEIEEYILICTDTTRNTNLKMLCPIDSVNLFNELFLLLLAGKFISLHEFSFIFSFFEFVIEMTNNDFSRQTLAEVLYSLSGMYFDKEELFGLEEEFIDFLICGNKTNDSEQCVILSEEMKEEETKNLPNQTELSLKNKNERSRRRKSKDFNKMADLFLVEHRSNILFLVSYLLCSEIPLKFKVKAMNHFSKKSLYNLEDINIKMKEKISIRYFNEIVILGMFDCNDEVFLEERNKKYFLNLLNVGRSTLQVYKDNVRQFIVSHTLSTTDSVIVSIFPGYLYFYDLCNYFKCNNFKLKKLRETISFDKKTDVNAKFINDSPLLYESQINSYLKRKGMFMDRQEESVKLQFNYKGNSYFLVLNSKFRTLKISLNKKLMGRLQIVNEGKDCNLEIYTEKILFKNNQFTFNDHFFLKDKLSFLVNESLLKYEENNFKINSNFQNDEISDLFFDVNTSVYFSNHRVIQELVLEKKYNFKCEEIESVSYVRSERVLSHGGCDYSTFEPYFGEIWDDLNLLFE